MSEAEQIKACAELDGWRDCDFHHHHLNLNWLSGINPESNCLEELPNYNSRNVLIPLIERHTNRYNRDFDERLRCMLCVINNRNPDLINAVDFLCAAPSQLREALLRATGKWTE